MHKISITFSLFSSLLIAPEGIEIPDMCYLFWGLIVLLIAPEGIEISGVCSARICAAVY